MGNDSSHALHPYLRGRSPQLQQSQQPRTHSNTPHFTRTSSANDLTQFWSPNGRQHLFKMTSKHLGPSLTNSLHQKPLTDRSNVECNKSLADSNPLFSSQLNMSRGLPSRQEAILKSSRAVGLGLSKAKILTFDPYIVEIDTIRQSLRESKDRIEISLVPMIEEDLGGMEGAIFIERRDRFSNRGRILFILAQRRHYKALLSKLNLSNKKNSQAIYDLRRRDSTPSEELQHMHVLKDGVKRLLQNIDRDLPDKSWKALMHNPESRVYQMVVINASKDEQILRELAQLQNQNQSNQLERSGILNASMLSSNPRRGSSPDPLAELRHSGNIPRKTELFNSDEFQSFKIGTTKSARLPFESRV